MKTEEIRRFYDELAEHYHLLFEDWDRSLSHQGEVLDKLLRAELGGSSPLTVLDAACGIGTQALGLALRGHAVHGSDFSETALMRAKREAVARGLTLTTTTTDLRKLGERVSGTFDAVLACDNTLPHLMTESDLVLALRGAHAKVRPGGVFLASIRDYDALVVDRPRFTSQRVFDDGTSRRVVFQVWDWVAPAAYHFHQFIAQANGSQPSWSTLHVEGDYRALQRAELTAALKTAGFAASRWLKPGESGYFQPVVIARRAS